jgi:hypothetical protein
MPVVSQILGHSSIGITVDAYGHVRVDDSVLDAAERAYTAWSARSSS